MQPMATENTNAVLLASSTRTRAAIPVNSDQFRAKKPDEVAAEDVFFHQYFSAIKKAPAMSARERKRAEKKKLRDIDEGEEGDEEDEIWKAMMQSAPDLEGEEFEDDDEDLDLAELESDDDIASDGDNDNGDVDIDPAFFDDDDDEDLMDVDGDDDTIRGAALADAGADEDDIPSDVGDFAGFDSDAEKPAKKAKAGKKDKAEKKRVKNLPTFASAEDYAKMLEDDEDEDR